MKTKLSVLFIICFISLLTAACAPVFTRDIIPLVTSMATEDSPSASPAGPAVPCFLTYYDPVTFLPGSLKLLVRAGSGVQIFDLQNMRELQFLPAPTLLNESSVAVSPDGTLISWALEGDAIPMLRLSNWKRTATIHSHQEGPLKIEFSPLGDRLYSTSHSDGIDTWDMKGHKLSEFRPAGELMNFGVSPDGKLIATIPADGPVSLWSTDDFHLVKVLGGTGGYDTSDAAFSPDGSLLAADLATGLFLWKVSDGSELIGPKNLINSLAVAFSPDGQTMAYADGNRVVISSPDGSQVQRILEGHRSPIFRILYSPDSTILVTADDREIRVWQLETGSLLAVGRTACP